MARQLGLEFGSGSECNKGKVGGVTKLLGDPNLKPEKPYTIILFPGGSVEISRTDDNAYWVHLAVVDEPNVPRACIIDARMDHDGRYNDEGNAALRSAVEAGDTYHVAFLVKPPEINVMGGDRG